eukprot:2880166-Rhodomonas_salina.1
MGGERGLLLLKGRWRSAWIVNTRIVPGRAHVISTGDARIVPGRAHVVSTGDTRRVSGFAVHCVRTLVAVHTASVWAGASPAPRITRV